MMNYRKAPKNIYLALKIFSLQHLEFSKIKGYVISWILFVINETVYAQAMSRCVSVSTDVLECNRGSVWSINLLGSFKLISQKLRSFFHLL